MSLNSLFNVPAAVMLPTLSVIGALALFRPCHKLGLNSIRQWLSADVVTVLNDIHPAWWAVSPAIAVLVAYTSAHWSFDSYEMMIAFCTLSGALAATLTTLIRFDVLCRLLPDSLTALLVISGLLFNGLFGPHSFIVALFGAVMGYGLPWLMTFIWKRIRKTSATMGRGDFAMTAGIGAWLGWQSLPMAITIAAGLALLMVLIERNFFPHRKVLSTAENDAKFLQHEVAFGPALAVAAVITWMQIG